MDRALAPTLSPAETYFRDGLGERHLVADSARGDTVEMLHLRGELAAVPSFEFALRERVSRLSTFRHAYYARVRGVERLTDPTATLALACDHVPGTRLSEVLRSASERRIPIDINAALCLIRQLVPAVATLHEQARDVAHGALGPERLLLTPNARIAVVEYVTGAALEQLQFSREQYWKDLRVALPRMAGAARFNHRTDVMQVGMVALAIILGRLLRDDEYPAKLGEVVASTWAVSAKGGFEPLPPGLRGWLARALQLDARSAFPSAIEASAELDRVLGDSDLIASPSSLEAFLTRYNESGPATIHTPTPIEPKSIRPLEPLPESAVPVVPIAPVAPVVPVVAAVHPSVPDPVAVAAHRAREAAPLLPPVVEVDEPTVWPPAIAEPVSPASRSNKNTRTALANLGWLRSRVAAGAAAGLIVLAAVGVLAVRRIMAPAPAPVTTGTLVVTSSPGGVQAYVDGDLKGITPITLTLNAGPHVVELRGDGEPRFIPVTMTAGANVSQYIELPKPVVVPLPEPVPEAPKVAADAAAQQPGWISVSSTVDMQMYEHDKLLGTSAIDRIMMQAGRHDIDLVNEALGYRATKTVQVAPGKVAAIKADLPSASIALNAVPWADVWVDGELVGQTPIGNLSVQIGSHNIVFRHPELGEQHFTQVVTLKNPARLSVDLRKK